MVELLADSKPVWPAKLVPVYQLTCICSTYSAPEVKRETVAVVDAFESTFTQTRNLQSWITHKLTKTYSRISSFKILAVDSW